MALAWPWSVPRLPFSRRASKLRHREYRDVGHLVAHILMERGERIAKIFQTIGELASHAAFRHVMIPAAHFREGDFQTRIGFDELRNLLQTLAQWSARIFRPVCGLANGKPSRPTAGGISGTAGSAGNPPSARNACHSPQVQSSRSSARRRSSSLSRISSLRA